MRHYCAVQSLFYRLKAFVYLVAASIIMQVSAAKAPVIESLPTHNVAQAELNLVAYFEDTPLFLGHEAYSTVHYPGNSWLAESCDERGCTNGCTIGFGYNLGARWPYEIEADLLPIIGKERTTELVKLANLTGTQALKACGGSNATTFQPLSRDESMQLLARVMWQFKRRVVHKLARENVVLNERQLAVLTALEYQNPTFVTKSTFTWPLVADGAHEQVAERIQEKMGTKFDPNLQHRRNSEAAFYAGADFL